MRALVLLFAIAACGRDKTPAAKAAPAEKLTPVANTKPAPSASAITDVSAAGKLDSIGPLAPQPPAETVEAVKKRSCGSAPPVELGASDRTDIAAAFGPESGIVAWSPNGHQLAIRAIDRSGKPLGDAHVVEAPARVSSVWGIRALEGHYIVFLSDTDYAGPSPILKLYAVLTDADGTPSPKITKLAIGDRGMIDDVSPGASRGVLVWAGPTPATHIDKGRLLSLAIDASGALAQSYIEFPDPAPGDRARPFFSLGEHAVVMIGQNVIVDGTTKARKDDPSYDPDGLWFAPTFSGASVPVMGVELGNDAKMRRYGALGLDGVFHFEKTSVAKTKPLRAPFEDLVSWGTGTASGGVDAFGTSERGEMVATAKLPAELSVGGIHTQIVWSGEQVLVFVAGDGKVLVAPLPCS